MLFIIIRMPLLDMRNSLIGDNDLIRRDVFRNAGINAPVELADEIHAATALFCRCDGRSVRNRRRLRLRGSAIRILPKEHRYGRSIRLYYTLFFRFCKGCV